MLLFWYIIKSNLIKLNIQCIVCVTWPWLYVHVSEKIFEKLYNFSYIYLLFVILQNSINLYYSVKEDLSTPTEVSSVQVNTEAARKLSRIKYFFLNWLNMWMYWIFCAISATLRRSLSVNIQGSDKSENAGTMGWAA